ncbi:low specificity L-threonine aldolase [Holzapfeliella sp. He02]|uniref:Low specificity L-threonine aldolase n=1 Tax=Holzapfeliella saturejae TaxID=3082953 RepID=A0ABU8SE56_9LACO
MLSFATDYLEGAHPKVLEKLVETNMVQEPGYGTDSFSQQAADKIRETINCPQAQIKFLVGGTQTNQVVIDAVLKKYEGVIAPDTGHIATHEAGAIEFTGHKVLTIENNDGKISGKQVDTFINDFYKDPNEQHMVHPGMVYISQPTEYGTLYTYDELKSLSESCRKHNIPLFIDGARLGYGLMSDKSDLTMADIAELCDVFYIGGTKIGALCGEAVVFTKNNEPKHFTTLIKQHGALLAKGRLTGIQFLTLFTDDLYLKISKHAIDMAKRIKDGFLKKGYNPYMDSHTNQQFFIVDHETIAKLKEKVDFAVWEKYDDTHMIVRFVTCWATKEESVDAVLNLI